MSGALAYVLFVNLAQAVRLPLPPTLRRAGSHLGLLQSWERYAPNPRKVSLSFEFYGTERSGRELDLLKEGRGERWDRLRDWFARDHRVRRQVQQLGGESGVAHFFPDLLAEWLCREWNGSHDGPLELAEVHLVSVHRELDRSGAPGEAERRGVRLDHPCFVGGAPGPGAPPVEVESVAGLAPAFPVVGKSTPFRRRRG